MSKNWYEKRVKELGYKGCRNCKNQIDVLRTCEWLEHGGDGVVHLICPRWKKRGETDGEIHYQAVRSYEGPEEEGRKIRKFSILKPEQELHYSNSTQEIVKGDERKEE